MADGGSLGLQGGITSVAEAVTISGTGFGGDGALLNILGNNTFSGTVTLGADARVGALAGALTLSAPVNGGFGLTKVGPGTLILSVSNGYTGGTTISEGPLRIANATAISGNVVNNASLVVAVSGTFAANVSGTGAVTSSALVRFTGTNTSTGLTTVTAQFLVAQVDKSLSPSSVVVTAGGVLDLNEKTVTIGGPVAVLGGGVLAPGTSPGTLAVNNSLTLATGQSFQINTATPGQVNLVIVPEPGALALAAAWGKRRCRK